MLLTDALEAFLVSRSAEGKAQKTISFYRDNISTYLAYLEEAQLLGDAWADPKTIELFLLSERSRNLSDFTVHARYRALRVFCNWLVSRGLLQSSPIGKVREPKRAATVPRRISKEEYEVLLNSIPVEGGVWLDNRDRLLLQLLFWTGLRAGEAAGLQTSEVNLAGRLVFIRKAKGRRSRYVPLPRHLDEPLTRYLFSRPQFNTPFLFISCRAFMGFAPALTGQGLSQMIRRRCVAAGLPAYGAHAFRHAFALTMLNQGGIDMGILAKLLGHSSTVVTQQFYADWETDSLRRAYELAELAISSDLLPQGRKST